MRRPLALAVLTTAAAGGVLLLVAGRTWGAVTTQVNGGTRQHVAVTGHAVAPALPALGLALLALAVAMLAANGVLRRLAGLLVVLVAGAAVAVSISARGDVGHALASRLFASSAHSVGGSRTSWWLPASVFAVLAVVAGASVVLSRGRSGGLGRRYEAPAAGGEEAGRPADDWEAIEQGQDPTVDR